MGLVRARRPASRVTPKRIRTVEIEQERVISHFAELDLFRLVLVLVVVARGEADTPGGDATVHQASGVDRI